ncbi:endo-1,4-beta-xylanase [Micromonospora sp. SL1-18]|uniref:endo-1,4-beta-xylanase n=1 Tax=Micromonospora sp. SL1-18 TaxID=3399128 RepID=UPI003A4E2094
MYQREGRFSNDLGADYIADAFRWARAADSKALLFYNDYNIEAFGSGNPANDKTQFVYEIARDLLAKRVPIDGVGSQSHPGTQYGN